MYHKNDEVAAVIENQTPYNIANLKDGTMRSTVHGSSAHLSSHCFKHGKILASRLL